MENEHDFEKNNADEFPQVIELQPTYPESDVPDGYFYKCASFIDILDKVDTLSRTGQVLRGSKTTYDANILSQKIWEVIRAVKNGALGKTAIGEIWIRRYLADRDITNASGLRDSMAKIIFHIHQDQLEGNINIDKLQDLVSNSDDEMSAR